MLERGQANNKDLACSVRVGTRSQEACGPPFRYVPLVQSFPDHHHEFSGRGWNPTTDPAVRELLDHIADELAKEYIRLMKQAGKETPAIDPNDGGHRKYHESRDLRQVQF